MKNFSDEITRETVFQSSNILLHLQFPHLVNTRH